MVIDSTNTQYPFAKLQILLPLDNVLPAPQFRLKSDTRDTVSQIQLSLENIFTQSPCVFSFGGGVINVERPTFSLQADIASTQGRQGDLVSVSVVLRGCRSIANYGVRKIQANAVLPRYIGQVEGVSLLKNDVIIAPIQFTLLPSVDTASAQIQLRLMAAKDTSAQVSLEDILPLPNAAQISLSTHSGLVRVIHPNIALQLQLANIQATPGEVIQVPFSFILSENLVNYGVDSLSFNIILDASMLEPIGIGKGTVSQGIRSIPISVPLQSSGTTNQVILAFRAAVGSTNATQIIPQLLPVRGITIRLLANGGVIRISTNQAGGSPTLFFSKPSVVVTEKVFPNPTKESVTVSFTLNSKTALEILLYDLQGVKIHTLLPTQNYDAGEHTLYLPLKELSNGQYRLVLSNPVNMWQTLLSIIH